MNEKLSKKISVYNFIFTVCIVIFHSKNSYELFSAAQNTILDALYNFYFSFGDISLGVFFMISGYLFYLGVDSTDKLKGKIKGRLYSLVIPFLVWNVLRLAYEVLYSFYSGSLDLSWKSILLGFTFEPFDGPLWYMFNLMLLIPFSPLFIRLKKYPRVFGAIVGATFVFSFIWGIFVESGTEDTGFAYWISRLINYLPLYLLGAYFGSVKNEVVAQEKYNKKATSLISLIFSVSALAYFMFFDLKIEYISWLLWHLLPITLWLSLSNNAFERVKITFPMKTTFFVYAMHMLLIGITNTIFFKVFGYNNLPWVVSILVHIGQVTGIYIICMCFAFVGKKLLPKKIFAMLSGGRVK